MVEGLPATQMQQHKVLMPARIWYFCYFSGMVCLWPYINLYFRSNGLSNAQIGVLGALRPWVNAPSSFLWSGLADIYQAHKLILIGTLICSTLITSGMAFFHTFAAYVALVAIGQFIGAPVGVLADTAVISACKEDGEYGKTRLWGAVGWGGFSTLAGWAVQKYGMNAGFLGFVLCMVPGLVAAWYLPFNMSDAKVQQQAVEAVAQPSGQLELAHAWSLSTSPQHSPTRPSNCTEADMPKHHACSQQLSSARSLPADVAAHAHESIDVLQGLLTHDANNTDARDTASDTDSHDAYVHLELGHLRAKGISRSCSSGASSSSSAASSTNSRAGRTEKHSSSGIDAQKQQALDINAPHLEQHQHNHQQRQWQRHQDQLQQQQQQRHRHQDQQQQQQQSPVFQQGASTDFWAGIRQLLSTPAVLVFMAQATVMGFGIGVIGEFLFLYLQELGGSDTLMGLSLTITCASEIPAFHYQGAVLQLVSVNTLLHIVLLTYFLRLGLYGMLPLLGSAWAVLPIELLHGITFACGWGAGTINSKRVAPPGLEATMQGIFQGLYFGLGQGLGALIGGLLMQRYGGQSMFFMCAAITVAGWALCAAAQHAERLAAWWRVAWRLQTKGGLPPVVHRAGTQQPGTQEEQRSLIGRYANLSVETGYAAV